MLPGEQSVGTLGSVSQAEGKDPTGPSLVLLLAVAPGVLTEGAPAGKLRVKFQLNFALKRNSVSIDPRQEPGTAITGVIQSREAFLGCRNSHPR